MRLSFWCFRLFLAQRSRSGGCVYGCTISNLDGKTVLLMPDDSHPLHGFTRRSSFRGQQTSPAGSRVAASGDDALSPREGATESLGAASTGAPST